MRCTIHGQFAVGFMVIVQSGLWSVCCQGHHISVLSGTWSVCGL